MSIKNDAIHDGESAARRRKVVSGKWQVKRIAAGPDGSLCGSRRIRYKVPGAFLWPAAAGFYIDKSIKKQLKSIIISLKLKEKTPVDSGAFSLS